MAFDVLMFESIFTDRVVSDLSGRVCYTSRNIGLASCVISDVARRKGIASLVDFGCNDLFMSFKHAMLVLCEGNLVNNYKAIYLLAQLLWLFLNDIHRSMMNLLSSLLWSGQRFNVDTRVLRSVDYGL
jgi:hypothetical protein